MQRSRLVARYNLEKNGTDLARPVPGWTDAQWSGLSRDTKKQVKEKDNPPSYEEYTSIGGFARRKRPPPAEFDGDHWHILSKSQRRTFRQSLSKQPQAGYEDNNWDVVTETKQTTNPRNSAESSVQFTHRGVASKSSSSNNLHLPMTRELEDVEVANIRILALEGLRRRLEERHITHKVITELFLSPFLPKPDSQIPQLKTFKQLQERPLMVSNSALIQILNISESSNSDCKPEGAICYFVSCELRKSQLLDLITDMEGDLSIGTQFSCEQFQNWKSQMEGFADENHVFIRYIGQTIDKTPYARYKSSSWSESRASLYEVFHKHLKKLPAESYNLRIFSLGDTFVGRPLIDTTSRASGALRDMYEQIDLYECVLICLFGPKSLLNTQLGGRSFVYSPSNLDITLFRRMDTSVAHRLTQLSTKEMCVEKKGLLDLSHRRCEWMRISSGQDRLSVEENTKQIRMCFLNETTSRLIEGQCLIAIIGDELPHHAIRQTTGFWDSPSRTARVVHYLLSLVSDLESTSTPDFTEKFSDFISFINVFPFPRAFSRVLDRKATEMLQAYLQVAQPILAITLGERALSQCAGKWSRDIISNVCIAYIQGAGDEHHRTHTIILPHLHPGFNARSSQTITEKRLYVLCWFVTWIFVDIALRYLGLGKHSKADRHALCTAIINEAKVKLIAIGLDEALRNAKEDLLQDQRMRKASRSSATEKPREPDMPKIKLQSSQWQLSKIITQQEKEMLTEQLSFDPEFQDDRMDIAMKKELLTMVQKLGRVPGDLTLRRHMADKVWSRARCWIQEKLGMSKATLGKFLIVQPENYFTIACIISHMEPKDLPQELQDVIPSYTGKTNNVFLGNHTSQQRRETLQRICQTILSDQGAFLRQRRPVTGLVKASTATLLDFGTKNGSVTFEFLGSSSQKQKISMHSKGLFKKRSYLDKRTLRLHRSGIDVINELGQRMDCKLSNQSASIPTDSFEKFSVHLRWMWQEIISTGPQD